MRVTITDRSEVPIELFEYIKRRRFSRSSGNRQDSAGTNELRVWNPSGQDRQDWGLSVHDTRMVSDARNRVDHCSGFVESDFTIYPCFTAALHLCALGY